MKILGNVFKDIVHCLTVFNAKKAKYDCQRVGDIARESSGDGWENKINTSAYKHRGMTQSTAQSDLSAGVNM